MGNRSKSINPHVGKRIRDLREARKITQVELAKIVYKGDSTVRMWELGKSEPDNGTLKLLSDYFDVSVDYLLGLTEIHSLQWTAEDIASGIQDTITKNLTPEEDELLADYREIGIKKGANAQALALKIVKQILES